MIRRTNRVELLKFKLESFKRFDVSDFKTKQLYEEAMDNIETEINVQKEKFMRF